MAKTDVAAPIEIQNPTTNALPHTIKLEQVVESVRRSGYPLQTAVSDSLRPNFTLQEEWSFIDSDTDDLRSLDILAQQALYDFNDPNKYRVRPELSLLIECKQSDLPYVFFLSPSQHYTTEFPALAGLFGTEIEVKTDDNASTWILPFLSALGFREAPFVSAPPNRAVTFSKCVRKGNSLELSGSEAFLSLVMPLVKATKHFTQSQRPPTTARYHDLHITVPIGLLDAPMLGVKLQKGQPEVTPIPWVRVFRHESVKAKQRSDRSRLYAIDLIHKDFLETYLNDHLMPFAEKLARTSERHDTELATGEGFISGMGKDSLRDLEARLKPRGIMSKAKDVAQKAIVEALKKTGIEFLE